MVIKEDHMSDQAEIDALRKALAERDEKIRTLELKLAENDEEKKGLRDRYELLNQCYDRVVRQKRDLENQLERLGLKPQGGSDGKSKASVD